jgi:hypothetical protein
MNTNKKSASFFCLLLSIVLLCGMVGFAADNASPTLQHATAFGVGRVSASVPATPHLQARSLGLPPSSEFSLGYHVLGLGSGFPNFNPPSPPPNPTLAVGGSEVIQAAAGFYADFDKSTGAIIPLNGQDSTLGNAIWRELLPGTSCANSNSDNGELLIKFDRAASRWIVTQNVFLSYAVCIAVSQTATFSDNLWYAYQFPVFQAGFPDYTKWGVWSTGAASDGYYQTWNNFGPGGNGYQGPVICGYDRAKLLVGDPSAEQICFQLTVNESSLLPADVDSPVGPPATEDEFFIGSVDAVDNSHLSLYSMHINDWPTGSASMTGLNNSQLIAVAPYTGSCSGQFGGDCVPQGGGPPLDSLGDRLMYRFAYWNDRPSPTVTAAPPIPPPLQHWLVNFDVESPTGQIGPRWFEFIASHRTVPVTSLSVFQQGTFAGSPADTNYRWMGSIARDNVQDILLGYSISSSGMYPSIAVAGRKYSDPQGTLSGEQFSVAGSGPGNPRWGEYSTMEIDPSDNCTFFYTTEYYMMSSSAWSTDVSSWKFPNCH